MSSVPGTGLSDELSLYKKEYNAKSRKRLDLQGWFDDLVVMRVALYQKRYGWDGHSLGLRPGRAIVSELELVAGLFSVLWLLISALRGLIN